MINSAYVDIKKREQLLKEFLNRKSITILELRQNYEQLNFQKLSFEDKRHNF